MQAKLQYITLFLFLFFTIADAQAPVRPLEPAFKAMENEEWDKVSAINNEISDLIRTDGDLLDLNQTPCGVFATFEEEEGKNRAL